MKKDFPKFKNWLVKKGNFFALFVMKKGNHNTWWIDFGTRIHVCSTMFVVPYKIMRLDRGEEYYGRYTVSG